MSHDASNHPQSERSDALVFFGATGDLAYKKIFPALQSLVKRGRLDVPVVGVAKSNWTLDQLVERARASLKELGGGVDDAAFAKLASKLRYVDGDYKDAATFARIRKELGDAKRPLHYLAIPPSMFRGRHRAARPRQALGERARRRREALRQGPRVGAQAQRGR